MSELITIHFVLLSREAALPNRAAPAFARAHFFLSIYLFSAISGNNSATDCHFLIVIADWWRIAFSTLLKGKSRKESVKSWCTTKV